MTTKSASVGEDGLHLLAQTAEVEVDQPPDRPNPMRRSPSLAPLIVTARNGASQTSRPRRMSPTAQRPSDADHQRSGGPIHLAQVGKAGVKSCPGMAGPPRWREPVRKEDERDQAPEKMFCIATRPDHDAVDPSSQRRP